MLEPCLAKHCFLTLLYHISLHAVNASHSNAKNCIECCLKSGLWIDLPLHNAEMKVQSLPEEGWSIEHSSVQVDISLLDETTPRFIIC